MEEMSIGDDGAAAAAAAVVKEKEKKRKAKEPIRPSTPQEKDPCRPNTLEEKEHNEEDHEEDREENGEEHRKEKQIAAAQAAAAAAAAAADRSYLKDLDKIWNTLRECDYGSWDESNTIFFDPSADHSSHPNNVVRVPKFKSMQDTEMEGLDAYIKQFLARQPLGVADFLKEHPYRPCGVK